jgi:enamine deaminase RidA (YjgF/YER057c/UK114 family)
MKDFAEMNKAYKAFWDKDPPSRVAVQVAALAGVANVEIRCAAALPLTTQKSIVV